MDEIEDEKATGKNTAGGGQAYRDCERSTWLEIQSADRVGDRPIHFAPGLPLTAAFGHTEDEYGNRRDRVIPSLFAIQSSRRKVMQSFAFFFSDRKN